jgi:hypothetical protein
MSVPREFKEYVSKELGTLTGNVSVLTADRSGTMGTHMTKRGVTAGSIYTSISDAEASMVTLRNDTVLVTPETHSQAASLTWSKYNTHLLGLMAGRTFQAHSARLTPSANYTPGWTLSGYYDTWANLRLAHPAGDAGNLVGVNVSGHYNYWNNVDLWSPGSTTEGAVAEMYSLSCAGGNNYFEGCTIGGDSRMRAAGNYILDINTNGVQNVFKDCVFMFYTSSADTYFIRCGSGSGVQNRWTLFDDCTFVAYSSNWGTSATVAVKFNYSGGTGHRLLFKDCSFMGVTDIISSDDSYRNNCWFSGGNTYLSATTGTGLYAVST